ncbi:MAG: glycosyltransferase family 4 protein [Oscillochloris sp.]|nr:glycosyltransferase family 4 protein [Oscillochloris sp.]
MRIAMIAPFGIRPKGTLLARMLPLAQALTARGHQPAIVAPPVHNPEDAGTSVVYDGVPVIHTAAPRLFGPAAVVAQSTTLLRAALAHKPHVLHLFKPKGFGGLAALAAAGLRPQLPLVLDSDDWEGPGGWNELLPYPPFARTLFAWQERDLPRRAAAVTVASRTLESLVWAMGVPPERVFYLPNGTPPPADRVPSAARDHATFLLYTRFWELDVAELAATLAAIHNARPDARLIVIGRGEHGEERTLQGLMERAGCAAMLDMRGWLAPQAIPAVLAEADLALAPISDTLINRTRGMAKLLELMAAGLPIVAGDVGAARDYLGTSAGVLVSPGNPGALAAAALGLLADPARRTAIANAALQAAERFRWERLAPTAEDAYFCALKRS